MLLKAALLTQNDDRERWRVPDLLGRAGPNAADAGARVMAQCGATKRPDGDFDADREQASRNDRAARRLPQRSRDQRRRGADLSDDELPVPRYRARRQAVRAE